MEAVFTFIEERAAFQDGPSSSRERARDASPCMNGGQGVRLLPPHTRWLDLPHIYPFISPIYPCI